MTAGDNLKPIFMKFWNQREIVEHTFTDISRLQGII